LPALAWGGGPVFPLPGGAGVVGAIAMVLHKFLSLLLLSLPFEDLNVNVMAFAKE
jgi:hypothetical protein